MTAKLKLNVNSFQLFGAQEILSLSDGSVGIVSCDGANKLFLLHPHASESAAGGLGLRPGLQDRKEERGQGSAGISQM